MTGGREGEQEREGDGERDRQTGEGGERERPTDRGGVEGESGGVTHKCYIVAECSSITYRGDDVCPDEHQH